MQWVSVRFCVGGRQEVRRNQIEWKNFRGRTRERALWCKANRVVAGQLLAIKPNVLAVFWAMFRIHPVEMT